ncbi:STAS domain-containing protein [Streptomyces sp. 1222.5]|uniref:STAS domain-containing protein n=1 Tax=Streptomyces sp. 1222.5 TaxID=1881026 RepID=UPI003D74D49E
MNGGGGITSLVLRDGDTVLLGVVGELDLFTGPALVTVVTDCLRQRPTCLVMDVSAVSFCDAAGLTALEAARSSAVRAGTRFALSGVQPTLLRILTVTGLDATFDLWPHHGRFPSAGATP